MDFRVEKAAFFNNPFIGLFARTSDSMALLPPTAPRKLCDSAERALGVTVHKLFIDNSYLLGLFCVINSRGAIIPSFARQEDKAAVKKLGFNLCLLDRFTPGNVVVANDKAALASPLLSKHAVSKIADCLGVEVLQQRFSQFPSATTTVVTNRGLFAYNELGDAELKRLEKIFGVRGACGTTNVGSPFNALGVVANSKGALVGESTSGFEVQRIYEALSGGD